MLGVIVAVAAVGEEVEVEVEVEEVEEGAPDFDSTGKFSPGLKAIVALCANACWTSRD